MKKNKMKHEDWTKAVTEKNVRLGFTFKQKDSKEQKEPEKGSETKKD